MLKKSLLVSFGGTESKIFRILLRLLVDLSCFKGVVKRICDKER